MLIPWWLFTFRSTRTSSHRRSTTRCPKPASAISLEAKMSTNASGRVVDEGGTGLEGVSVTLQDDYLFTSKLGSATTQHDGTFSIGPYEDDFKATTLGPRNLQVTVYAQNVRSVLQKTFPDVSASTLPIPDLSVHAADVTGWTVTLGAAPKYVNDGNGIRLLVNDQEAWAYLATKLNGATSSIGMMQLEFDIPSTFNNDPSQEEPQIVLSFASPVDPNNPRKVNQPTDYRPERLLLDRASHGVKVRVLIPKPQLETHAIPTLIFLVVLALIVLAIPGLNVWAVYKIVKLLSSIKGTAADVSSYISQAGSTVNVGAFPVTEFNRVHAKLALIDDLEAIIVASPFIQGYYDTPAHHVNEPMRGSGVDIPIHDVSFSVRGPSVADMHEAFALHWNLVKPGDVPATITPAPPLTAGADQDEKIASLQLIRTLNEGVFPAPLDKGENGILEAYLRAIGNAKQYIYLENQYFTNDSVASALVAALKAQPTLQIIMLINITPDIPFYPGWQNSLINQIRKEADPTRIGFFSAWTHESAQPPKQLNPRIIANYIHTKAAIVNGTWATMGSANLDGASLDSTQLVHAIQFGNLRNHELNYAIFNNVDGHPATDFIDLMRRRLWSEHLGIAVNDAQLAIGGPNDGQWLTKLWRTAAERKRASLQNNPGTPDVCRVLEYKDPDSDPKKFLKNLSIGFDKLDFVPKIRSFSFFNGAWDS